LRVLSYPVNLVVTVGGKWESRCHYASQLPECVTTEGAMAKHLLTETKVRSFKAKAKPYREPDGENLYLYIAPSGVKSWQFRYRLHGKPQTLILGKYPPKSLAQALE
jgi:hypothetical protein